jgi:hypothetical protein
MKNLIIIAFSLVSINTFANSPAINSSQLMGTLKGESANGPCTVKIKRAGDMASAEVYQNMTTTESVPFSVKALLQKISGNQCGRKTVNNDCGEYTLKDSMQSGAGYNNEISFSLINNKGNICLDLYVTDASFSDWIGSNHCTVNMNGSGTACLQTP